MTDNDHLPFLRRALEANAPGARVWRGCLHAALNLPGLEDSAQLAGNYDFLSARIGDRGCGFDAPLNRAETNMLRQNEMPPGVTFIGTRLCVAAIGGPADAWAEFARSVSLLDRTNTTELDMGPLARWWARDAASIPVLGSIEELLERELDDRLAAETDGAWEPLRPEAVDDGFSHPLRETELLFKSGAYRGILLHVPRQRVAPPGILKLFIPGIYMLNVEWKG